MFFPRGETEGKISFGVVISAHRPFRPFAKDNSSRRNDEKVFFQKRVEVSAVFLISVFANELEKHFFPTQNVFANLRIRKRVPDSIKNTSMEAFDSQFNGYWYSKR
jgi:hypothetical protein